MREAACAWESNIIRGRYSWGAWRCFALNCMVLRGVAASLLNTAADWHMFETHHRFFFFFPRLQTHFVLPSPDLSCGVVMTSPESLVLRYHASDAAVCLVLLLFLYLSASSTPLLRYTMSVLRGCECCVSMICILSGNTCIRRGLSTLDIKGSSYLRHINEKINKM